MGGFFVALNCIRTSICYANQTYNNGIVLGKRDKYIPKNIAKKGNLMKISEIMKLESLEIKNFKSIPYMNIKKIGAISLFLGTNGSGKTAIFDAMRFIRECVMARDITAPLQRRGGFYDLLHRNSESSKIHFKLVLSNKDDPEHKLTYTLEINGSDTVTVSKEDLTETQKIGKNYENSKLFNYRKGKGYITDPKNEKRELQATNIALGKLGEFTEYKKVNAFRNYVADWYFADFFVNTMRDESLDFVDATKLREDCRNLREVLLNIKQTNKDAYGKIVNNIKLCLPEIKSIGVVQKEKQTHLEIIDKNFTSPFSELSVSDGALKLLAYITLLAQKEKISFLMIEEPENQIYVESLTLLFELFDSAAFEGLQMFISTHSPDFIKNASTDNVIIVTKQDGKTQVQKLASNKMLKKYVSTVGISEAWRDGGLFSI